MPPGHAWADGRTVATDVFLATPMVVRDPSSNARWTVDAVLAAAGLRAARGVTGEVRELMDRTRDHVRIWLR